MPFYATVGPISLLDVCTRGLHALRLVEMTIWRLFGRLSQGDYTSSGRLVLGFDFFAGDDFYWDVVAALDIVRRGGLVTLCLTFSCSLIGMSSLCSTSRARGGISHASRAFSLAARRGGPCKALIIRSYATEGRYFVSAHYLTRASS